MTPFAGFRDLRPRDLPGEVLAALALTAIALPEQMATARLLGLPPLAGLLAYVAGTLAVVLLGRHHTLSSGADSTIAPVMAAGLAGLAAAGAPAAGYLPVLALMAGVAVMLVWPLRLGWIADLLSTPVTAGFMAAIGIRIAAEALGPALGLVVRGSTFPARIADLATALPGADPAALGFGLGAAAISGLSFRFGHRIPGPLIALALAGAAASFARPAAAHLPRIAAGGPAGLAGALLHPVLPGWDALGTLLPLALMVALLVLVQSAAVLRALPDPGRSALDDPGRDLAAVGLGSVFSGLIGGFAVNASPPRTALARAAGAKSQLSALLAAGLSLAAALAAAPLLARVPEAALSGVLLAVGLRLIPLAEIARIRRHSPLELGLVAAGAALLLLLPILPGMGLAVTLSLLHAVYTVARPTTAVLARVPGTTVWWNTEPATPGERVPGVLVFALGAPLNFLNARHIARALEAALAAAPQTRLVVLEGSGVIGVDYTGAGVFRDLIAALRGRGISLALARLENPVAEADARRTGLAAAIGAERIFLTVDAAVRTLAP